MRRLLGWTAGSALVMLGLPGRAVAVVKGDAGMGACLLLFFAVDPAWSVLLGALAGREMKGLWSLPLLSAALFLAGAWTFFDRSERAFLLYAAIYLALGLAAMPVSALVKKHRKDR